MEFTASRNDVATAVTNAANGIPSNPGQPVRAGMKISVQQRGRVSFSASDGDVTFTAKVQLPDDEKTSMITGAVVVPGKLFTEVIKNLPAGENVKVREEGQSVIITCDRATFKLRAFTESYPELPVIAGKLLTVYEGLGDAIRKVTPAAAKTEANPALTSVEIGCRDGEYLTATATDRYRVATITVARAAPGALKDSSCLVPAWAAERFSRAIIDAAYIGWDERVCTLTARINELSDGLEVTTRLMQGSFPDWRKLMPEDDPSVEVKAEELTGALKRSRIASEEDSPVELTFARGQLRVEAGSGNRCTDVLDCGYDGEEFTALFGIGKLLDGLAGCNETCKFGFTTPSDPVHIHSGNYKYMILPRRKI